MSQRAQAKPVQSPKSLGQLAYEHFTVLIAIDEQIGKGGKLQRGPDPWERLTPRIRHHWETFAGRFGKDVVALHKEGSRRQEAERERLAMRADVFEQEVRRRVAEEIGKNR